jgi:hypothetical protein
LDVPLAAPEHEGDVMWISRARYEALETQIVQQNLMLAEQARKLDQLLNLLAVRFAAPVDKQEGATGQMRDTDWLARRKQLTDLHAGPQKGEQREE